MYAVCFIYHTSTIFYHEKNSVLVKYIWYLVYMTCIIPEERKGWIEPPAKKYVPKTIYKHNINKNQAKTKRVQRQL